MPVIPSSVSMRTRTYCPTTWSPSELIIASSGRMRPRIGSACTDVIRMTAPCELAAKPLPYRCSRKAMQIGPVAPVLRKGGNMLAFLCCLVLTDAGVLEVEADCVVRGATLYDGSGGPGTTGDIAIRGDRIVALGNFAIAGKPRIIEGEGLVVAPGFIDLHTHSDDPILAPATRANLSYLTQGVTTIVTGNCGAGPVDAGKFYHRIRETKVGTNVAHQVPHNALRQQVMGNVNRPPSPEELDKMRSLVAQGMKDGAWGLATGLIYTPGSYADTDELVELAKVASAHGGFYASHIRGEGSELLAALNELLDIGRRANIPVHISHFKASGRKAWNKMGDAIALVEQARANGQQVTADQYPYTASSTSLAATL